MALCWWNGYIARRPICCRTGQAVTDLLQDIYAMARFSLVLCAAAMLVPTLKAGAQDQVARYDKVHTIKIGGEGGWDYLSVDPGAHRLYVTHATKIVMVDLEKKTAVSLLMVFGGTWRNVTPYDQPVASAAVVEWRAK